MKFDDDYDDLYNDIEPDAPAASPSQAASGDNDSAAPEAESKPATAPPPKKIVRDEQDTQSLIFVCAAAACLIAMVIFVVSLAMSSQPEQDKSLEASYKNLAKKQKNESPFPAELTARFRKLKDRWNANGPVSDSDLRVLSEQNSIEKLQLNYTDVTADGIKVLQDQPLSLLVVSGSPIDRKFMTACSKINALRRLCIFESSNLDDKVIEKLTAPEQISEITLRNSDISDAGVEHIAKTFKQIETLDIMHTQNTTAKSADYIVTLPKLMSINISYTKISPEGVARIARMKSVRAMYIVGLGINDDIIPALMANGKLTQINISENPITDKTVLALIKMKSLGLLAVGGCSQLSKSALEQFQRARPDCKLQLQTRNP